MVEKEDGDGDRGPWSVEDGFGFRSEGAGFRVFWLSVAGTLSLTTCQRRHVQFFVLWVSLVRRL